MGSSTEKQAKFISTFKAILRNNGPKYFYKGFFNSMIGTAIFRGSFNGLFDNAKQYTSSIHSKACVAYMSAIVAGLICYPLDIARRRSIIANSK